MLVFSVFWAEARGKGADIMSTVKQAVSFYKFSKLKDLSTKRELILNKAREFCLFGTILLAEEGVNGMLWGEKSQLEKMKHMLEAYEDIGVLEFKWNDCPEQAFRRTLVKIKSEIITMRRDIDPLQETGKRLDPHEFQNWLESGKDMVVLDTRNRYEYALGSFQGAIDPEIDSFEGFADYIDQHADQLQGKPVVTFCTGGVRCEKATAYMMQKGIQDVYQLEGGIIKYFENVIS